MKKKSIIKKAVFRLTFENDAHSLDVYLYVQKNTPELLAVAVTNHFSFLRCQ